MYKKNAINTVFLYGIIYPDDENAWRKRPVKSRVCGLKASMVRQEYDKINSLKGLK